MRREGVEQGGGGGGLITFTARLMAAVLAKKAEVKGRRGMRPMRPSRLWPVTRVQPRMTEASATPVTSPDATMLSSVSSISEWIHRERARRNALHRFCWN